MNSSLFNKYKLKEDYRLGKQSTIKQSNSVGDITLNIAIDHVDDYNDFVFYQAEYDDEAQLIKIRVKSFWQLDSFCTN